MCRETIFDRYGAAICRDQRAEKLRHLLAEYCFDGREAHGAVDRALPGIEHSSAAAAIKVAVETKYANKIDINTAIERFLAHRDGEASRQRALQLFPTAHSLFARRMDHGRAEAALIALYGLHSAATLFAVNNANKE
jgi:hypothetical protein